MNASANRAVKYAQTAVVKDEIAALYACLSEAQHRLDAIGAQVAEVHLDACLHELARSFIPENNASKPE